MPIETLKPEEAAVESVDAALFNGEALTTEGSILGQFLENVDWSAFFDDADIREFVAAEPLHFRTSDDGSVSECDADTAGAEEVAGEVMEGVVVAELVDGEDLRAMFVRYVQDFLPEDTLADKHRLMSALAMLEDEEMDEARLEEWKKKSFRVMRKKNKDLVSRMMLAMLHKGAIRRVSPGTGYPSKKSDYGPGGSSGGWKGYPAGTGGGLKAWLKYKGQNAAKIKQAARKSSKGGFKSKELSQSAAQIAGKKGSKVVKTMKAAVKKVGKAAAKATAKAKLFGSGKKKIVASDQAQFKLHEGANLAAAAIRRTNKRMALNEGSPAAVGAK